MGSGELVDVTILGKRDTMCGVLFITSLYIGLGTIPYIVDL